MDQRGQLERLTIMAYEHPNYEAGGKAVDQFDAFVNPAELNLSYEIEYSNSQAPGNTNSRMDYGRIKPSDLTLSFFLDGTGVRPPPKGDDVQAMVENFKRVTGYSGDKHRTRYLKVLWGKLEVRRCVLTKAEIHYKLFKASGIPLRAVIAATFTDNSDDRTREAREQNQSPDLTHLRLVKAGDTLPALCSTIYGDPGLYLQVAAANGLDDFRRLVPGSRLVFPPLEK